MQVRDGNVRDEINAVTPRLRRYARALVAGDPACCEIADTLVHATLMRALGSRGTGSPGDLSVRLFATVTQLHRDLQPGSQTEPAVRGRRVSNGATPSASPSPISQLAGALLALPLEEREALLLVTLEGFDHVTAARILRVSRPVLFSRLTRARTALAAHGSDPNPLAAPVRSRVPYLRLVVG